MIKNITSLVAMTLNIELSNEYIAVDMISELSRVKNHKHFVKYCKDNFNHADLNFMSSYQKFLTLVNKFEKMEFEVENKDRIEKMDKFALNLRNKVKDCNEVLDCHFSELIDAYTKEKIFTNYEINILEKIGTLKQCYQLLQSVSGRDMLYERIVQIFLTCRLEYKS